MVANSIVEEYYCEVRKHLHCPEDVQNALLTKVNTPMTELQVDCPNFDRSTIIAVFGEPEELANHLERFFLEEEMSKRTASEDNHTEEITSESDINRKTTSIRKRKIQLSSKIEIGIRVVGIILIVLFASTVCFYSVPDVTEENMLFIGEEVEIPAEKTGIGIIDYLQNLND